MDRCEPSMNECIHTRNLANVNTLRPFRSSKTYLTVRVLNISIKMVSNVVLLLPNNLTLLFSLSNLSFDWNESCLFVLLLLLLLCRQRNWAVIGLGEWTVYWIVVCFYSRRFTHSCNISNNFGSVTWIYLRKRVNVFFFSDKKRNKKPKQYLEKVFRL